MYVKFSVMSTEPGKKKRILYSFLLSWLLLNVFSYNLAHQEYGKARNYKANSFQIFPYRLKIV